MMQRMSKPIHGYLILIPILVPHQTICDAALPTFFDRTDLLYINSELTALAREEQDEIIKDIDYSTMNINVNYDDDDINSQETIPGRTERSVYGSKRIKYGMFTVTLRYKTASCIVSVKLEKTAKYGPFTIRIQNGTYFCAR
jgi:hypothetical protein